MKRIDKPAFLANSFFLFDLEANGVWQGDF
ncbi:hypothetical protein FBY10_11542 [Pseudomonas sp. SJZ103]|nr:hypothetical protein FBY10_11542 [Pseudomonas sp. SJZ103]TWC80288.1 hypothetical protein FBY08_116136 [Pseudomonas sp. SJZ094]